MHGSMTMGMNALGAVSGSDSALITFVIYLVVTLGVALLPGMLVKKKSFVGEYFLGSRGLGSWALALTIGATVASGGTFMGFPSKIYTHGWTLGLWIASYMVVPLCGMALLGKRMNRLGRLTGALTVPELLSRRFESRSVGLVASLGLIFMLFFYIMSQFKAGGDILTVLLKDVDVFKSSSAMVGGWTAGLPVLGGVSPEYLVGMMIFAAAVILYTTYGGFRAVVWTDVFQGLVMLGGVMILLGLTLNLTGGLENATRDLAKMTTPEFGVAVAERTGGSEGQIRIESGRWFKVGAETGAGSIVIKMAERAVIEAGEAESRPAKVLRVTSEHEIARIRTEEMVEGARLRVTGLKPYAGGAGQTGVYVSAPGPDRDKARGFLGPLMALSFFAFWAFGTTGQPSNMVRLMAFKDAGTLKRSIVCVAFYITLIYFPLVITFCCARVLLPGMETQPDLVMPTLAWTITELAGVPWLAGILVAAPFAAVMSSVDSFLIQVSASVVRDIYQTRVNPVADEARIKKWSYWTTSLVGVGAMVAAMNPPRYLQDLIIFASEGLAGSFMAPVLLSMYWRRMTAKGAIAGIAGGFIIHLSIYTAGYLTAGRFGVYEVLGVLPLIWEVLGSTVCVIGVSLLTRPPGRACVEKLFGAQGAVRG